jgi:phosphoribosylformylglycinamidine synthase
MNDLDSTAPVEPERDRPNVDLQAAFEAVVGSPNTASKRWVYRQYDHEVQVRTATPPGDDAAVLAIRREGLGVAFTAGADPNWTDAAPYDGARAVALENATNLAAKGATPLAAVDCLNGGNPKKSDVYGGFEAIVDGLADTCAELGVPVVGGNVSLYNDSVAGPIPPTPTLAMVGTKPGYDAPPAALAGEGELVVVNDLPLAGTAEAGLGGSEYLARFGGNDRFPTFPDDRPAFVETLATVADADATHAVHDVSHGGLAVALAEMVTDDVGANVTLPGTDSPAAHLFHEQPGRVVVETTDPAAVTDEFDGVAPVEHVGSTDDSGVLDLTVEGESLVYGREAIADLRSVIERELA